MVTDFYSVVWGLLPQFFKVQRKKKSLCEDFYRTSFSDLLFRINKYPKARAANTAPDPNATGKREEVFE